MISGTYLPVPGFPGVSGAEAPRGTRLTTRNNGLLGEREKVVNIDAGGASVLVRRGTEREGGEGR